MRRRLLGAASSFALVLVLLTPIVAVIVTANPVLAATDTLDWDVEDWAPTAALSDSFTIQGVPDSSSVTFDMTFSGDTGHFVNTAGVDSPDDSAVIFNQGGENLTLLADPPDSNSSITLTVDLNSAIEGLSFVVHDVDVSNMSASNGRVDQIVATGSLGGSVVAVTVVCTGLSNTCSGNTATGINYPPGGSTGGCPNTDSCGDVAISFASAVDQFTVTYNEVSGQPNPSARGVAIGDFSFEALDPEIAIAKDISSGPTSNGDGTFDVTYAFVAENVGNVDLHDVQITDSLSDFGTYVAASPAAGQYTVSAVSVTSNTADPLTTVAYTGSGGGTAILDGDTGSMVVGETFEFEYTVTFAPDPSGGANFGADNQATGTGDLERNDDGSADADTTDLSDDGTNGDPDGDGEGNEAGENDLTPLSLTLSAAISLTKSFDSNADEDASGTVSLGDTLTYDFSVDNTGDVRLDPVSVADPLTSPVTCAAPALNPGASTTCSATYSVTQADVDNGQIDNTATASGTAPWSAVVTNPDSETVIVPQNPSIAIAKSLTSNADEDTSGDVSLGDTLTYGFVATNDGNVTLDNVAITDPLAGLSALSCVPAAGATLAPGAAMTCSATYSVTQGDVDNGQVDNTATVNATDPNAAPVSDADSESVATPQVPGINLSKTQTGNADEDASGTVTLSDTLTYTFVASNTGNVTLDNVAISDPLSGLSALSCVPAAGSSLAPGAAMTCTATYSVSVANADAAQVDNTATVNATDPNAAPVSDVDSESVVVNQNPSISLVKSLSSNADEDASGSVSTGDTLTYGFVATNSGNVTLFNVAVSDPLAGLSSLTCSPSAGSSLAPGAAMSCSATYSVTQTDVDNGQIDNTATVNGVDPLANPVSDVDSETVVVLQSPSISLLKSLVVNADEDASGDESLGDTLTYGFQATNNGNVTLDSVVVSDPMAGLSALSCVPAAGSSLAPGAAMTCSATYSITQSDVDSAQIDNTATVNATDPNAAPVSDVDSETVLVPQNPSIVLVKSLSANADEDASGDVSLGDTLTYGFVATNDGNTTLFNIAVSDPLPGLSALSCVPAAGSALAAGAVMTCSATYSVTQGDVDNGQVDNTATVFGVDPLANPVGDVDSETVVVAQNPSISLVKSLSANADEDASGDVSLGDTLTYGFMATNDGDVTLDNVAITDPLAGLSALSCVPVAGSSLAPGAAMTCSAT
ncbi:MAG: DUF11 domain-containing protein, partial [bacterium]|nr:DUF11 domain-containing protein [bacterium]